MLVFIIVATISCTQMARRHIVQDVTDILNVVCSDEDPLPLCLKKIDAYEAAIQKGESKDQAKTEALAVKP